MRDLISNCFQVGIEKLTSFASIINVRRIKNQRPFFPRTSINGNTKLFYLLHILSSPLGVDPALLKETILCLGWYRQLLPSVSKGTGAFARENDFGWLEYSGRVDRSSYMLPSISECFLFPDSSEQ